jgi:hypothetical protein
MLAKIRHIRRFPEDFLQTLFKLLIKRVVSEGRKSFRGSPTQKFLNFLYNISGKPKFIGVQLQTKYMDTPFCIPLRSPRQNNPKALTAELLSLAKQSGGRLRILKSALKLKISAVWPRKLEGD